MTGNRSELHPTFFWQGALIVLPVIVLAAIGVFALRQDRALARHEAIERAQTLADSLAAKIWNELVRSNAASESKAFVIDSAGALVFPPPYPPVPVPHRLDDSALGHEQARLWTKARRAEWSPSERGAAIVAYRKFIELRPPRDFLAAARYGLGALLVEDGREEEAASNLTALVGESPQALGESGLPLAPMAELKLLPLNIDAQHKLPHRVLLETVCSNAVCVPTTISPALLQGVEARAKSSDEQQLVRAWWARWEEQELDRALFRSARERLAEFAIANANSARPGLSAEDGRVFWFTLPRRLAGSGSPGPDRYEPAPAALMNQNEREEWVGVVAWQNQSNLWVHCLKESNVAQKLGEVLGSTSHIPDYLGINIQLVGRRLTGTGVNTRVNEPDKVRGAQGQAQGGRAEATILASASPTEDGGAALKVNLFLTSSAALFKSQNARTFWFGAVVLAAALAALAGLLAAYRAFYRQLRLSEMKSNFVSSVSHELRAPIASVRLMAESLERGKVTEGPRQKEYFRFIVQECRRLSALIENVLDFSRIEQGRKEYEFEPTDIVALTRQTVKLMEPYAAERNVSVALTTNGIHEPGSFEAVMDGKAIQQALINLIDNAIKHSPKGQTVTVGLELEQDTDAQSRHDDSAYLDPPTRTARLSGGKLDSLHVWVEDRGEGIPTDEHEKIFQRFYRRGSELRRETSGVGIGLSIVQHIVVAHGGQVAVRSELGQGSRFTICLPLAPLSRENGA